MIWVRYFWADGMDDDATWTYGGTVPLTNAMRTWWYQCALGNGRENGRRWKFRRGYADDERVRGVARLPRVARRVGVQALAEGGEG